MKKQTGRTLLKAVEQATGKCVLVAEYATYKQAAMARARWMRKGGYDVVLEPAVIDLGVIAVEDDNELGLPF